MTADQGPTQYPGPAFLAVGGSTMGYCQHRCGAWIRGRWLGSISDTTDVVDGSEYGHTCDGPTGVPVRRCTNPEDFR